MFLYVLFLIVVLTLICFTMQNDMLREHLENPEEEQQEQLQEEELKYYKALVAQKGDITGPQGVPGPPGPPGPSGGSFIQQGPLRSKSNLNLFLDRLWGTGVNAAVFLNEPNYSSHQSWTLQSDGQLANQFGLCLKGDANTGKVYMDTCGGQVPSPDQQWIYSNWGQLKLKGDASQCLTVKSESNFTGGKQITGMKPSGPSTQDNLLVGTLMACQNQNVSPNQQWSFF